MESRLNLIKNISYTRCSDVTSYLASQNGKAKIKTKAWHPIKLGYGRNTFDVSNSVTPEGMLFNTTINFPIREKTIVLDPIILKVEFCEGKTLLIGSPVVPARVESFHGLNSKNIQIIHSSWHFPHEYTL